MSIIPPDHILKPRHGGNAGTGTRAQRRGRAPVRMGAPVTSDEQVAALIELRTRFSAFVDAYERDRAEDRKVLTDMTAQLAQLAKKEQQAIGAMRMAKLGYGVIAFAATIVYAIGLPKVGVWLMSLGK